MGISGGERTGRPRSGMRERRRRALTWTLTSAGALAVIVACGGSDAEDGAANGRDDHGPMFDDGPCEGLACRRVACPDGKPTRVTGTVYDPAGQNPLYNAVVYVPNGEVAPIRHGATCDRCDAVLSGKPIATALTDVRGHFELTDVPTGKDVPLVIQIGKWRRRIVLPEVAACATTEITDRELTRLPRNQREGDIPRIALTTGGADTLECLLRKNKIGLDDDEFSTEGGSGSVHLFAAEGGSSGFRKGSKNGESFPSASAFWRDPARLARYDMVLLSCEGAPNEENKGADAYRAMHDYAGAGGRVFATHWHRIFFTAHPSFATTGAWEDRTDPDDPSVGVIDASFPKGAAFRDWMAHVEPNGRPGELFIKEPRHNLDAVDTKKAKQWITLTNLAAEGRASVQYMSFNTPLEATADKQCGRAVFSDLHVSAGDESGRAWPDGCRTSGLSAQEKALEFMLFDLSACVQEDDAAPSAPRLK